MKITNYINPIGICLIPFLLLSQDPGDECSDPIYAVTGENTVSGSAQFFSYTAQLEGHLLISSQPDTSGIGINTHVWVYSSCDLENDLISENDDISTDNPLSSVLIYTQIDSTYIIKWSGSGSSFIWTLVESDSAPELPDLSFESIVLDADNKRISFDIKNLGILESVGQIYTDLWVNNENWDIHCGDPQGDLYQSLGNQLDPDSTVSTEFDLSILGPGIYEIYISVDNDCQILESNETNNTAGPFEFIQYPMAESLTATGLHRSVDLNWEAPGEQEILRAANPGAFINISENGRNIVRTSSQERFIGETRQRAGDSSSYNSSRDEGDSCEVALNAVSGQNSGAGESQWFTYTATESGYMVISSQNDAGDALWDTKLEVYTGCDSTLIASNDDCCGYYGPSSVQFQIVPGEEYKIFWDGSWGPGPFQWTLSEIPSSELPDLLIGDVDVNEVLRSFTFNVYNQSMLYSASDIYIDVWIDPLDFSFDCYPATDYGDLSFYVESLPASSLETVEVNLASLPPGDHEIYLGVDVDCTQMEMLESNNSYGPIILSIPDYPELNILEYLVYRDEGTDPLEIVGETTYLDTGLVDGSDYCYTIETRIVSGDTTQLSLPTEAVCATTSGIFANLCSPENIEVLGFTEVTIENDDTLYVGSVELNWPPVGAIGGGVDTSSTHEFNLATGSLTEEAVSDSSSAILAKNMSSGWMSFDISNLVPGLRPLYTELKIEVTDTYFPNWSLTPMYTDPVADSVHHVYADILSEAGTDSAYGNFIETEDFTPGNYSYILKSTIDDSLAVADTSKPFTIGVHSMELGNDFYFIEIAGWSSETPPKLIVHYSPEMVVEFEATLSLPTYNQNMYGDEYKLAVINDTDIELQNLNAEVRAGQHEGVRDETCENFCENTDLYYLGVESDASTILYPHIQRGVYSLQSLSFLDGLYFETGALTPDTARLVISLADEYGVVEEVLLEDMVPSNGYLASHELGGIQYEADETQYLKVSLFPTTPLIVDGEQAFAPFFMSDDGQTPSGFCGWELTESGIEFASDYMNWSVSLCRNYLGDFAYCGLLDHYNVYASGEFLGETTQTEFAIPDTSIIDSLCFTVSAVYEQGDSPQSFESCATTFTYLSLTETLPLPQRYSLDQNFPNPFNPITHIRFSIPTGSPVTLSIFDLRGRLVNQLVQSYLEPGTHEAVWSGLSLYGEQVGTGVYFYTLEAGEYFNKKKMIYLK